jgi:hypothetical protein
VSARAESPSSEKANLAEEKAAAAAEKAKLAQEEAAAKAKLRAEEEAAKEAAAAAKVKLKAEEVAAKEAAAAAKAKLKAEEEAAKAAAEAAKKKGVVSSPKPVPNFPIANYGALGDNKTDNTTALNAAIAAAVSAKGGNVTAGPGTYLFSGPITLPSGVTLTGSSMSAVTFKPTKSGAAFVLQGTSGIAACTLLAQPGDDSGYGLSVQDPTPTQRSVYASAGASVSLMNVNLASVCCIDCDAINIMNCTENSALSIYGSRNILIENVNFNYGFLSINPDSNQKQSTGLSLVSCTWPSAPGGGSGCAYVSVGGAIAKGASQGIQGCNFANNEITIFIQNDNSPAQTYFSVANNLYTGATSDQSLFLQNGNPNVVAYVTDNKINTVAGSRGGPLGAAISTAASAGQIGSVVVTGNDFWAPLGCSGGSISITSNTFSQWGEIVCETSGAWLGPLTITGNSISLSGQTSNASSFCPVLVELSPTDSSNVTGPVTIQNNKCTSTVALKDYIILLDAPNDKTTVSGNTITPAGAVTAVVHTQADFDALIQQLNP